MLSPPLGRRTEPEALKFDAQDSLQPKVPTSRSLTVSTYDQGVARGSKDVGIRNLFPKSHFQKFQKCYGYMCNCMYV